MSIEAPSFVVPHISEWTTSSMWGKISDVKFNNSQPTLWCSGSSAHPQCYHCLPAHSQKDCCKGLVSRSLHIIGGLGGPSGPVEDSRSGRCERQIDASGSNPVKAINVVTFFALRSLVRIWSWRGCFLLPGTPPSTLGIADVSTLSMRVVSSRLVGAISSLRFFDGSSHLQRKKLEFDSHRALMSHPSFLNMIVQFHLPQRLANLSASSCLITCNTTA